MNKADATHVALTWTHGAIVAAYPLAVNLGEWPWVKEVIHGLIALYLVGRLPRCWHRWSFCAYTGVVLTLAVFDFAHGGILEASLYAHRRLWYFLVPFSLVCRPTLQPLHVGLPLIGLSIAHWVLAPEVAWQYRNFRWLLASGPVTGVIAAFGAIALVKQAQEAHRGWLLAFVAMTAAAYISLQVSSKSGLCMLLLGLMVVLQHARWWVSGALITALAASVPVWLTGVVTAEDTIPVIGRELEFVSGVMGASSVGQRLANWEVAVETLHTPSVLIGGVGWNQVSELIVQRVYGTSLWWAVAGMDHSFHNVALDMLVAYGVVVGGLYLGVLGVSWWRAYWRERVPLLTISLVPLLMLNSWAFGNAYEPIFWTGIMLTFADVRPQARTRWASF
jgi:O-antigen ligase